MQKDHDNKDAKEIWNGVNQSCRFTHYLLPQKLRHTVYGCQINSDSVATKCALSTVFT